MKKAIYALAVAMLVGSWACGGKGNNVQAAQEESIAVSVTAAVDTPAVPAATPTVELLFAGDAMQHMPQVNAARQPDGTYDYSECLRWIKGDVAGADYAVVNLECTLGGKPYSGYPAFSAPDAWGRYLVDCGFDLVLTANNHCLDRGARGLRRTINRLDGWVVPHIGTYVSQKARQSWVPYVATVKGVKIAFLDYTYGTNGISPRDGVVVDYIDTTLMSRDIGRARELGAQAICVNMHWGVEYKLEPVKSQRRLADFLIDKGVDMIIGGHPHVLEPFEMRRSAKWGKRVLLVYSLGNLISAQKGIDSRGGALVKVTLTIGDDGRPQLINPRYSLFFCQRPSGKRGSNFTLIPENRPDLLRSDSRDAFTTFMRRAHTLVMSHNIDVPQEL